MIINKAFKFFVCFCLLFLMLSQVQGQTVQQILKTGTKAEKLKVGDEMIPFTLPDLKGEDFSYKTDSKRALVILFLTARQTQTNHTLEDIKAFLPQILQQKEPIDIVGIIIKEDSQGYFQGRLDELEIDIPILLDAKFELWGKLGIIAAPTTIIVDKNGVIFWRKAGYGYKYTPALRDQVSLVLGLIDKLDIQQTRDVESLVNNTNLAVSKRHLNMARLLSEKGRDDSAIIELQKALEFVPESVEVLLELGRLYCRTGQNQEVLSLVEKIKTDKNPELAQIKMLTGWAQRQLGNVSAAESLLEESLKLNPNSSRALFEMGKIYQGRGEFEKAMQYYNRALSVVFK